VVGVRIQASIGHSRAPVRAGLWQKAVMVRLPRHTALIRVADDGSSRSQAPARVGLALVRSEAASFPAQRSATIGRRRGFLLSRRLAQLAAFGGGAALVPAQWSLRKPRRLPGWYSERRWIFARSCATGPGKHPSSSSTKRLRVSGKCTSTRKGVSCARPLGWATRLWRGILARSAQTGASKRLPSAPLAKLAHGCTGQLRLGVIVTWIVLLSLAFGGCGEDVDLHPVGEARLADYSHSEECAGPGRGLSVDWEETAKVEVVVEGLRMTLIHENAMLNCCLDSILVDLNQEGSLLKLVETEVVTTPCDCICPFKVTATIGVSTPGTYTMEVWTAAELVWTGEVEVAGAR